MRCKGGPGRADCDRRSELDRVAVDTRRDRRERDRPAAELVRKLDGTAMARREQLGLIFAAAAPDRAHGVEHVPRRQRAARGWLHLSWVAAAEQAALGQDRRSTRAVDRAVHAAAAEQ